MVARSAWQDRFTEPSVSDLRKLLRAEPGRLFDTARKRLGQIQGATEHIAWYGDGWHWTLEYRMPGGDGPIGVVVPNPDDLQLAIPLERGFVETLKLRGMKRTVREGIDLARAPFDNHWGVWSIQFPSIINDLSDLLEQKLGHLTTAS